MATRERERKEGAVDWKGEGVSLLFPSWSDGREHANWELRVGRSKELASGRRREKQKKKKRAGSIGHMPDLCVSGVFGRDARSPPSRNATTGRRERGGNRSMSLLEGFLASSSRVGPTDVVSFFSFLRPYLLGPECNFIIIFFHNPFITNLSPTVPAKKL